MAQKIAIVTDSTADMPLSFYEENDVTMVPLTVWFGDEGYKDWIEMPPKKFFDMMRAAQVLPKTSQPSVQDFIDAYKKHSDCDHVISMHLSSKLSGTHQSASIASKEVDIPVTVIDGKLASVGTAVLVKALLKARDEGKSVDEMVSIVDGLTRETRLIFYVDTLKYLEMGGRIGKASALAGSILNIKPILGLEDGIVVPLKKIKGRKKVNKEIIDSVREQSGGKKIHLCLVHADAEESITELESAFKQAGIAYDLDIKSEIGSVIGTYVGPGAFAALFYPAE